MSDLKERLYNPFVVVFLSVTISVMVFYIVTLFIAMEDYTFGLTLSIVIPILASYPISLIMVRHHRKIVSQRQELERLDKINKKLFALISHDIRSPIASLKGVVDLLISEDLDVDEGKIHFNSVSDKIENLLEFLNNLLTWSKMQIENKTLEPKLFNSEEVIESILELYDELRTSKGVLLTKGNISSNVYADKESYAFIVRNLLHNAIKFTEKNQNISVSTEVLNDKVHTIIEDNGIGIDKDRIDKLINNQEWLSTSGTSDEVGTGLGIQTSIQYLKKQNGELRIDSEVGKGTKMTIILPEH